MKPTYIDEFSLPETFSDDLLAKFRMADRKRKQRIKTRILWAAIVLTGIGWSKMICSGDWHRFVGGMVIWLLLWSLVR